MTTTLRSPVLRSAVSWRFNEVQPRLLLSGLTTARVLTIVGK